METTTWRMCGGIQPWVGFFYVLIYCPSAQLSGLTCPLVHQPITFLGTMRGKPCYAPRVWGLKYEIDALIHSRTPASRPFIFFFFCNRIIPHTNKITPLLPPQACAYEALEDLKRGAPAAIYAQLKARVESLAEKTDALVARDALFFHSSSPSVKHSWGAARQKQKKGTISHLYLRARNSITPSFSFHGSIKVRGGW